MRNSLLPAGSQHALRLAAFAAAVTLAAACGGGGDRSGLTADSAVVHTTASGGTTDVYAVQSADDAVPTPPPLPPPPVYLPDPAVVLAEDSAAGQQLYRTTGSCSPCHGLRGEGVAGLGTALNDSSWVDGNGSLSHLYASIRDGVPQPTISRTPMPAQAEHHSQREIFQLAAWIYSISRIGVTVPDSMSVPPGSPPLAAIPRDTTGR